MSGGRECGPPHSRGLGFFTRTPPRPHRRKTGFHPTRSHVRQTSFRTYASSRYTVDLMVIALARTGQALGPALMLGTSNNLLSRSAVGSSRSRYSGDSHRFGYAAALCSTVAVTQKTIGIVRISFFSAFPGLRVWATRTSGCRSTSSFAAARNSSGLPVVHQR